MQLNDGFIVGIYDYCDRWCETCAFTSRCRVFAMGAEIEASLDPQFMLMGAGLLRSARAMQANLTAAEAMAEHALDTDGEGGLDAWQAEAAVVDREEEVVPPQHQAVCDRAEQYLRRVLAWLGPQPNDHATPGEPRAVIAWFPMMLAAKIGRALRGVREAGAGDAEAAADAAGSGKVALLGVERSHAAWLTLLERGDVSRAVAEPCIADLAFLGEAVEDLVPGVREFVRPGLDEPEAVALLAASGGR